jgi:hypothetical protein
MLSYAAVLLSASIAVSQEGGKLQIPAEVREHIDAHMIGKWTFKVTWGNKTYEGAETIRWTGRKTGLLIQNHANIDGKRMDSVVLLGWGGGEKALVGYGFSSEGETWQSQWTKFSKNKWEGHGTGTFQGEKWDSPCTLEFGKDSMRYEDITGGKPWVGVYTRAAKPKGTD